MIDEFEQTLERLGASPDVGQAYRVTQGNASTGYSMGQEGLAQATFDEVLARVREARRLPAKRDKDRTWRRTAVFTRDEVETIISARSTPHDRRVLASLMFLGAMRFGESAALTWRDYDPTCTPLGKLAIEKSYSTK